MNLTSKTILLPSIVLLIGSVIGTSATTAFADDPFKNKVEIDDNIKQKNDCNVDTSGPGSLGCAADEKTTTSTINVQGEKNKVDLDLDTKQKNDCKGEASGSNTIVCETSATHDIGEINIFP
jgi:hypothetical protein